MRKFLCGITTIIMALALVSCGDDKDNSSSSSEPKNLLGGMGNGQIGNNVAEEDLPYGATICELSKSNDDYVKVMTDFDRRYFSDTDGEINYNEIYKIHDYIIAIDTNDHELFKNTCHPEIISYVCEQSDMTVDEYIDNLNAILKADIGENSSINYIDVSNCYPADDENFQSYYKTRDDAINAVGAGEVTSRKTIEVGGYTTFKGDGGIYQLTNYSKPIVACIYEIDGQIYIL